MQAGSSAPEPPCVLSLRCRKRCDGDGRQLTESEISSGPSSIANEVHDMCHQGQAADVRTGAVRGIVAGPVVEREGCGPAAEEVPASLLYSVAYQRRSTGEQ